MRVEPYAVGSYLHVIKRGARGGNIVRDDSDHWRFLRVLYFMNDVHVDWTWHKVHVGSGIFERPDTWPERKPLVHILCYTLMPNHVHILLQEIRDGGTTLFMKKIGQSMTEHANKKYDEKGSLFQGAFRSKTIDSDQYLQQVAMYIMVKNTLELYPEQGLIGARKDFERAWSWAISYPFSSLGDYINERKSSCILARDFLSSFFGSADQFKSVAQDMLQSGVWLSPSEFE